MSVLGRATGTVDGFVVASFVGFVRVRWFAVVQVKMSVALNYCLPDGDAVRFCLRLSWVPRRLVSVDDVRSVRVLSLGLGSKGRNFLSIPVLISLLSPVLNAVSSLQVSLVWSLRRRSLVVGSWTASLI
jgi:hypothetical protein